MSDIEYGPCVHIMRTCEWICPNMFEAGSLKMHWDQASMTIPRDTVPVTPEIARELKWGKGATGPDTLQFDAMVFTKVAYDLFVLPDLIVTHGYKDAQRIRTRHRACLEKFGVCVHLLSCEWICPRVKRNDLVEWDSKHSLTQTFDAVVLTPKAYERFALPFQVRTKGAARAHAQHLGYLRRVRTLKALEKGIWPKAKG